MAFKLMFGMAFLLSLWSTVGCDFLVEGVLEMECHDRYFVIALDLTATGANPRFEAVDRSGVHAITEAYAAKCGYSITVLPFLGMVELRASYFSCHVEKDRFEFKFNLITNYDGEEAFYILNKTCPPPRRWSPREVTCEVNYMEVSVRSELSCPSEKNDWTTLKPTYSTSTSDWQVIFQRLDEQLPPMNLSQARKKGYTFDLMHDRIVFRTPYEKPESYRAEVNDVPVEVVHATVFSRKSWVILMVDLIAACSMYEGSYDSGYVLWKTPEALYSSYNRTQISVGLNGELVDKAAAKQLGFTMETRKSTIKIGIPYNAEGGYRKSFVDNGIFEFYMFSLYLKQTSVDEHHEETAVRFHRTLVTPLLPCSLFTEDRTIPKEGMFTIYLGEVPEDVELISVQLNGEEFEVPSEDYIFSIVETIHSNKTHSYTLKVPLQDPIIIQEFSEEDGAMLHMLDVNYTLVADPAHKPYYHTASVTALMDVSPPSFHAVCNESGINFKLAHRPSDYLWDFSIGPDRLTPALAAKYGYIMSNNSQSLLLFVPRLAHGLKYTDVTLKGFLGTFEILVKSHNTSQVRTSTTKTCPFNSTEMILCSTSGWMTVVADLSLVLKRNQILKRTSLISDLCVPKETDGNGVLFSFPLHSCGSKVELSRGNVIYRNKIYYSSSGFANATEGVTVQCLYPLAGLHSLFSAHRFESDKEGVGSIIPSVKPTPVVPRSTEAPTRPPTTAALQKPKTKTPVLYLSSFYPTARYIRVPSAQKVVANFKKDTK